MANSPFPMRRSDKNFKNMPSSFYKISAHTLSSVPHNIPQAGKAAEQCELPPDWRQSAARFPKTKSRRDAH
jgi:hypothetical protein